MQDLYSRWVLAYWSHCISEWVDLWRPDSNAQPEYDLAWRAFQAGPLGEFIG